MSTDIKSNLHEATSWGKNHMKIDLPNMDSFQFDDEGLKFSKVLLKKFGELVAVEDDGYVVVFSKDPKKVSEVEKFITSYYRDYQKESMDMDEIKKLKEEFSDNGKQDLIRGFNEAVTLAESLEKNFAPLIEAKMIVSKPLTEERSILEEEKAIPDEMFDLDPLSLLPGDDLPATLAFGNRLDATQLDEDFEGMLKTKVFNNPKPPQKLTESQKQLIEATETVKSDLATLAEDAKKMLRYVEAGSLSVDEANEILGAMAEYLSKTMDKVGLNEAGEMFQSELDPGGEWHQVAQDMQVVMKDAGVKGKVEPFDQYQGPRGVLPDHHAFVWLNGEEGEEGMFVLEYKGDFFPFNDGHELKELLVRVQRPRSESVVSEAGDDFGYSFSDKDEQIAALAEYINDVAKQTYEYETSHMDSGNNYMDVYVAETYIIDEYLNNYSDEELGQVIQKHLSMGLSEQQILVAIQGLATPEEGGIRHVENAINSALLGETDAELTGMYGKVNGKEVKDVYKALTDGLDENDLEKASKEVDEGYWTPKMGHVAVNCDYQSWNFVVDPEQLDEVLSKEKPAKGKKKKTEDCPQGDDLRTPKEDDEEITEASAAPFKMSVQYDRVPNEGEEDMVLKELEELGGDAEFLGYDEDDGLATFCAYFKSKPDVKDAKAKLSYEDNGLIPVDVWVSHTDSGEEFNESKKKVNEGYHEGQVIEKEGKYHVKVGKHDLPIRNQSQGPQLVGKTVSFEKDDNGEAVIMKHISETEMSADTTVATGGANMYRKIGDDVSENKQDITIQKLPNGDLKILLKDKESDVTEDDVLEALHQMHGLDFVSPEEVGALTDAPIVGDVDRDDQGGLRKVHSLYFYPDYAVNNFADEMKADGFVIFKKANQEEGMKNLDAPIGNAAHSTENFRYAKNGMGEDDSEMDALKSMGLPMGKRFPRSKRKLSPDDEQKLSALYKKRDAMGVQHGSDEYNNAQDQIDKLLGEAVDASLAPPKKWFSKMKKQIKAKNRDYDDDQVDKTVGDIWYHKLSSAKKQQLHAEWVEEDGESILEEARKFSLTEARGILDKSPIHTGAIIDGAMAKYKEKNGEDVKGQSNVIWKEFDKFANDVVQKHPYLKKLLKTNAELVRDALAHEAEDWLKKWIKKNVKKESVGVPTPVDQEPVKQSSGGSNMNASKETDQDGLEEKVSRKKHEEAILAYLNKVADALGEEGFEVSQPKLGQEYLNLSKKGQKKKGTVEIYLGGVNPELGEVNYGIFTWTSGSNEEPDEADEHDVEVDIDEDGANVRDLVGHLESTYDFELPTKGKKKNEAEADAFSDQEDHMLADEESVEEAADQWGVPIEEEAEKSALILKPGVKLDREKLKELGKQLNVKVSVKSSKDGDILKLDTNHKSIYDHARNLIGHDKVKDIKVGEAAVHENIQENDDAHNNAVFSVKDFNPEQVDEIRRIMASNLGVDLDTVYVEDGVPVVEISLGGSPESAKKLADDLVTKVQGAMEKNSNDGFVTLAFNADSMDEAGKKKLSIDDEADQLLAKFLKKKTTDDVAQEVDGELPELSIGNVSYHWGNRELSAHTADKSFTWDLNNLGSGDKFVLFSVTDGDGEELQEDDDDAGTTDKKKALAKFREPDFSLAKLSIGELNAIGGPTQYELTLSLPVDVDYLKKEGPGELVHNAHDFIGKKMDMWLGSPTVGGLNDRAKGGMRTVQLHWYIEDPILAYSMGADLDKSYGASPVVSREEMKTRLNYAEKAMADATKYKEDAIAKLDAENLPDKEARDKVWKEKYMPGWLEVMDAMAAKGLNYSRAMRR